MPFQNSVNQQPAPARAGDFASSNPRSSTLTSPGGAVAGAGGVLVGRFAWLDVVSRTQAFNVGQGIPNGFLAMDQPALITAYLGEASMMVPAGLPVVLHDGGDFWVVNSGTTSAVAGQKAYAINSSGLVAFAATGAPATVASGSASTIAAGTSTTVTGSIAVVTDQLGRDRGVLTVTAVGAGAPVVGAILSGTGVITGTVITSQLTGTVGSTGTYAVSIPQTVASTTVTCSYGVLTVGGTVVAGFAVGQTITGTGVTAGTFITGLGTGAGGAGTYNVSVSQTASSTAISAFLGTETVFSARSFGAVGELVKISSRIMG